MYSYLLSVCVCVYQLRVRREAEERERDREMVAVLVGRDDALTEHEKRLAEEARYDLSLPLSVDDVAH